MDRAVVWKRRRGFGFALVWAAYFATGALDARSLANGTWSAKVLMTTGGAIVV